MATLSKVPSLVASHSVFNANGSLFAEICDQWYAVYSYGKHFPVAIRRRTADEPWILNRDRYSATTSRHQSKVRQGIDQSGRGHLDACTQTLKNLLAGGV